MKRFVLNYAAALALLLAFALISVSCSNGAKKSTEQAAGTAAGTPVAEPTEVPAAEPTEAPAPEHNPVICTVGTVEFRLSDFLRYYEHSGWMVDYEDYIKDRLVEDGILLSKANELGITLTDSEKKQIETIADSEIKSCLEYIEVDPAITDPGEIRASKIEALEQFFTESDKYAVCTVDEYREDLIRYYSNSKLIEKLKNSIGDEIVASPEDIEEYCRSQTASDKEEYKSFPSIFANAYSGYIQGRRAVPLYVPADMFTVKFCVIECENAEDIINNGSPAQYSADRQGKIDEITARLESGVNLGEFITDYVENADYNDSAVFTMKADGETVETNPLLGLREHGYIMNGQISHRYGDSFGAAACVLHYGENWRIPDSVSSEPAAAFYHIEFFTTTDGVRIAKVEEFFGQYSGTYFLYISEVLPEGEVRIDMNDTGSEEYRSLAKYALYQQRNDHISETVSAWFAEDIPYSFDDEFLDDYCENTLGPGSGIYPA